MDLGKHIASYHLELAQLWRCPVMWFTVWKGTAQDCIDHMRRVHKVLLSVKAANLAKYFPAWTVTRDQWSKMLMPCVSGVAIDKLLFSRVCSPLCHRYRLISRMGSHAAFRGTYLKHLRLFLEESDYAVGRRLHRRLTPDLSAGVVKSADNPATGLLRPTAGHRIVYRPRRPRRLKGVAKLAEGSELGERPSAESQIEPHGGEDSSPSFSPNRVHEGHSQNVPSEGSLFNVSPLSPELVVWPTREGRVTQPGGVLLPTMLDDFDDSVLGDAISYARIEQLPGSESPLSLPVYAWPPSSAFMMDSVIQTVLAPRKSERIPAETSVADLPVMGAKARVVKSGLPGCPYRFLESGELPFTDGNPVYGLQLHHPRAIPDG